MTFAKSLSGHDKNHYYLILKEEGEFVFLINGTTRSIENPKKKNKKHVQVVKKLPFEILEILEKEVSDLTVKKAIREYEKLMNHNQGSKILCSSEDSHFVSQNKED